MIAIHLVLLVSPSPSDASHPPSDAAAPPADASHHPSDHALPSSSDDNSGTYPDCCSSSVAEITDPVTSILSGKIRKNNKVKIAKKDVMTTWTATKSLLLTYQEATSHPTKMNSEVLSPLFRTPPTDFATLYTAPRLTQNIPALVVGPERRTVIELDLDFYCRAVQIQQSVKNKNWITKAGTLHICFAALHALWETVEGSGMDTEGVETGIYSSAALQSIYGTVEGGGMDTEAVETGIYSSAALQSIYGTVEGSGMDTEGVETGIYSSAALQIICGGK